ncbi:hypothetical protein C8R46DRAFT_1363593 [Mycena filopes]|nr:hypothetical protein C8R46DRAFT_1363593 [Mycena filopes]
MTTVPYIPAIQSAFPTELLEEIFLSAAGNTEHELGLHPVEEPHPGVALSQVCGRWRRVAWSTQIWNRVTVQLEGATYPAALARLNDLFTRAKLNNLVVELIQGLDPQGTPRLCLVDIVQPYSSRLVALNLFLDIDVIHDLVRLPAGTFPNLRTLQLTVAHRTHSEWLVFGEEDEDAAERGGVTEMSALAPLLSSFAFHRAPGKNFTQEEFARAARCSCSVYPQNIGLDLASLTGLSLGMPLGWWTVHLLLRHCVVLERCSLNVYIDEEQFEEDEKEEFELPALRSLFIEFDSKTVNHFFLPLRCPALTELDLTDESQYSHHELMEFLRRSRNRLSSLRLNGIKPLMDEDLTELFTLQPSIKQLTLSDCDGTFWNALWRVPLLLPSLEAFTCENLTSRDMQDVMNFMGARCVAGSSPLRTLSLSVCAKGENCPADPQLQRLEEAIVGWEALGIDVELEDSDEECRDYRLAAN